MVKSFDHVTIVVRDVEKAKRFFALLGFKETKAVVISGKVMEDYMGVRGIEADHITLALENATPHTEVQLLHYRHPDALPDPNATVLVTGDGSGRSVLQRLETIARHWGEHVQALRAPSAA